MRKFRATEPAAGSPCHLRVPSLTHTCAPFHPPTPTRTIPQPPPQPQQPPPYRTRRYCVCYARASMCRTHVLDLDDASRHTSHATAAAAARATETHLARTLNRTDMHHRHESHRNTSSPLATRGVKRSADQYFMPPLPRPFIHDPCTRAHTVARRARDTDAHLGHRCEPGTLPARVYEPGSLPRTHAHGATPLPRRGCGPLCESCAFGG